MIGIDKPRMVLSTRPPAPGDEETALECNIRLVSCPSFRYRWITPPRKVLEEVVPGFPGFPPSAEASSDSPASQEPTESQKPSASIEPSAFQDPPVSPDPWVFTSRRGVEGWGRVWHEMKENRQKSLQPHGLLRVPKVYAVGEGTVAAFRDQFQSPDVHMAEEQHGMALVRRMLDDGVRKAIHFCGTARRTELRDAFRKNQLDLVEVEVYQRTEIREADPEVEKICHSGQVHAILFFSPDGVAGFYRLYGLPDSDWIPVAIGPTTAEAVRKVTGREPRIAPTPLFREMIRLVR